MYHPSMKAKMEALERRKAELTRMMAETPSLPAVRLHPSLGDRYCVEIARLAEVLQRLSTRPVATGILPGLICNTGWCQRLLRRAPTVFPLLGKLAGILGLAEGQAGIDRPDMTKPPRVARAVCSSGSVVAGTGFEPVTFRL